MALPETREEHYLNAMLGNEACPHYPEATRSRVENYLDALCHKSSGGSAIVSDHAPTMETTGAVGQLWENSSTGELYILESIDDSDPSDVVYNWVVTGGGASGATKVMLYTDGTKICSDSALTTTLTFSEVKELVDNKNNIVVINDLNRLTIMNYEAYEEDCIWFQSSYEINDRWWLDRLSINEQNEIKYTDTELAEKTDLPTVVQTVGTSTTDVMSQKAVTELVGDIETILTAINTGAGV